MVLSDAVEILDNPRDDPWSRASSKAMMVRSTTPGSDLRAFLEDDEVELLRVFVEPQVLGEALFERREIQQLRSPRTLLAEWLRLEILVPTI